MMPDARQICVTDSSNVSPDNIEAAMWHLKIEDNEEGAENRLSLYPDRPGEPDCLYYLRTGVCGYGTKCKYNHPTHTAQNTQYSRELPQRDGQPDCQFFLKTGTCKYGITCKYHHPQDKYDTKHVQLNFLGLPFRKHEKPCAYYVRTGLCRYGVACKFNHPQPATSETAFPATESSVYGYSSPGAPTSGPAVIGGISPWPLSGIPYSPRMQSLPTYVPLVLPVTQGSMPVAAVQQDWSTCMGSVNHISSADMLASNPIANSKHQEPQGSNPPLNLPDRPDQPECQYYMKTGSCKYGTSCKYHHPKQWNQSATSTVGPFGLPLRPGHPVCTFYTTYGSCKYGTACKFDHPLMGYYGYTSPSFSNPYLSIYFPNQRSSQIVWTAENPSSKLSKLREHATESETRSTQQKPQTNEHGNIPTNTSPSTIESQVTESMN